MPANDKHVERVNDELRKVGLTNRGLKKFSKRSLHHIIHPEEHITGAMYGRFGEGSFHWYEGMLISTDRRLIFFDLTPGAKNFTELTYELVTGIEHFTARPFTSVTIFAGVKNYSLRFVNTRSANIFTYYVERRRLENPVELDQNIYNVHED